MYNSDGFFTVVNAKENTVHRGQVLKKAADESGLTVETIVERMHYASRNTFYNHTRREDLSVAILKRYGRVLGYDFSQDIPEVEDYGIKETDVNYLTEPKTKEEATRQRDFYLKLYMSQLEEFRKLLEEYNDLKDKVNIRQG